MGAPFFLEGARAHVTGAMVPQHLAAQLLAIEDGRVEAKVQRNTQTELLAVLVALLTWSEELRGCELVIFDDSQAAEGNLLSGSATTAHSKELLGTIWLVAATLRVRVWVTRIPGRVNPGDPFSRPLEPAKQLEAAHLVRLTGASVDAPVFPMALHVPWPRRQQHPEDGTRGTRLPCTYAGSPRSPCTHAGDCDRGEARNP